MVTCMSHNFRYNSFSHKLDLHLPTCPPNLCAILSFLHTVVIRRHDLTRDPSSCSRNPTYDKDMCGYNDKAGCKPLNGCGSLHAYWYILSFFFRVLKKHILSFLFLHYLEQAITKNTNFIQTLVRACTNLKLPQA